MMINGIAGISPDIIVYRHAAWGSFRRQGHSGTQGCGWGKVVGPRYGEPVRYRYEQAAEPRKTPACNRAPARAVGMAGKARPAGDGRHKSTQTPTKTKHLSTGSIIGEVAKPEANAANA